jgi:hypothetical protein
VSNELPAELIDEASLALTSVLRLTLPPERWSAVGEAVHGMDDAVWAGDEKALRSELKRLRGAVIGTAPRPVPGENVPPKINPLSYKTTDYVTRTPLRWITAILIGGAAVLVTMLALVMVVLTVGDGPRESSGPAPTTTSAPPAVAVEEGPSAGGTWYPAAIGLVAVAGVGVFAGLIWRRRARAGKADDAGPSRPARTPGRLQSMVAPDETRDAADRLVAELRRRRE